MKIYLRKTISIALVILLAVTAAVSVYAVDSSKAASGASNSYTNASQQLDNNYGYDGEDLGATYTKSATTFKVWAPTATKVTVNIYDSGSGGNKTGSTDLTYDSSKGVWSTKLNGDYKNKFYTYTVSAKNVTGSKSTTKETQDIYSVATGINGERSQIVDLSTTNPTGWDKDKHVLLDNSTDSYVWEVHVKDFSYDSKSGVSSKNRGKFLAFTETGTTLNNDGKTPTLVDYLKKLGVTTVQITPFYDFSKNSIDEGGSNDQFNWGYDPVNYNVPEGAYSSNPRDGNVRIKECKQMIQALHNAGISVVMDVVYNHTASTDSSFEACVPNYYYRMQSNGKYSDGSGCGNETASERRMFRNFMIQSCMYWVNEYHIDGFRFDLMGVHDVETMNLLREKMDSVDKRLTLWGEGWTGGDCTYPDKTCTGKDFKPADRFYSADLNERVAIFNDGIRDSIKGSVFELKGKGWVQGDKGSAPGINEGVMGNVEGTHDPVNYQWTSRQPSQTVTYTSCHDNQTLWDRLAASQGAADFRRRDDKFVKQNKLAGGILQMSQGITFTLAGEEMGRSKDNDENSYKSSVTLNMIDWGNAKTNADIVNYYAGMRKIREKFSPLRDMTKDSLTGYKCYAGTSSSDTYAAVWHNNKSGEWKKLAVIANNSSSKKDYTIDGSEGKNWVILANESGAGTSSLGTVTDGKFSVEGYSMVVAVDKESYDNPVVTEPATTEAPTTEAPSTAAPEETTAPATEAPPKYDQGDVNRDKTLSIKDATLIQKYLALLSKLDDEQIKLADINGDKTVSIKDATKIQRILAGLDK